MGESPDHGISDQAAYLVCYYLLRRQEMADRAAGRQVTACDEILTALSATDRPGGENVVLLDRRPQSPAFAEIRTLVERVQRSVVDARDNVGLAERPTDG